MPGALAAPSRVGLQPWDPAAGYRGALLESRQHRLVPGGFLCWASRHRGQDLLILGQRSFPPSSAFLPENRQPEQSPPASRLHHRRHQTPLPPHTPHVTACSRGDAQALAALGAADVPSLEQQQPCPQQPVPGARLTCSWCSL